MSICIDDETEQYLDVFTMPMSGLFAGSLLAIEPVTRMMMIVKLCENKVLAIDYIGAAPSHIQSLRQMVDELCKGLFAFKVKDTAACLN